MKSYDDKPHQDLLKLREMREYLGYWKTFVFQSKSLENGVV